MQWRSIPSVVASVFLLLSNSPALPGDWQAVEAIPVGSAISVKDEHRSVKCVLKRVSDKTLFCVLARRYVPIDVEFDRQSIRQVRLEHPGRNVALGTLIGFGAGAGIGYASSRNSNDAETRVYGPIGMAILGGLVGGLIMGRFAISHGKVVYRR
jgi:hypothetical protein